MPTPTVALDALIPDAIYVAGLRLQPLTLGAYLLLEKIRSPFAGGPAPDPAAPRPSIAGKGRKLGTAQEAADEAPSISTLDIARTLYILTRGPADLRPLYEGFNREQFENAVWSFSLEIRAADLAEILPKLQEVFTAATSTVIGGERGQDVNDSKKKTSSLMHAPMG